MKRIFIAFAVLAAACSCSGPSNVKDVAKKVSDPVFRTYCVAKMDLDGDKAISMAEADSVRTMDISDLNIKSLKGIENFRNLRNLNCSRTSIKVFDSALPSLQVLKCTHNPDLATINLSGCPALQFLYASHSGLKSLSLTSQTGLFRLWIDNTPVSRLDLSGCPRINNINVMNCPSLKELTLSTEVNREVLYLAKDDALVVK